MTRIAQHVSFLWAGREHAEELALLHATLFDMPWSACSFRELLNGPGATAFLARAGSPMETIGFVLGRLVADEAEILSLGVSRNWQRRSIGRQLVEAFCRAARKAEARRLYLEVASTNAAALALYGRLGFEQTGRRAAYYGRPGASAEDAINLALDL